MQSNKLNFHFASTQRIINENIFIVLNVDIQMSGRIRKKFTKKESLNLYFEFPLELFNWIKLEELLSQKSELLVVEVSQEPFFASFYGN